MKKTVAIGRNLIKEGGDVFVIAEAGVNHNGELKTALQLVDAAARAGADAVKFQTFRAEQVVTAAGKLAEYQKDNLNATENQLDMLRRLELKEEFYQPIIARCQEKQIVFLSTPHGGRSSVDFLESLGITAYKIGSGDLTNFILLDKIAKIGKPIILSTGMATLAEVRSALRFLHSKGNDQVVVLHCTTSYPCFYEDVNLAAMVTMMQELDAPVGYSDHTLGDQVAIMAATLGAAAYECHFTLDRNLPGPDHRASAEPQQLKEKIEAIRRIKKILGTSRKIPSAKEKKEMIPLVRRSIVAARAMTAGHILSGADIEAKRPGYGLSPVYYEKCLGKRLFHDVNTDDPIFLENLY